MFEFLIGTTVVGISPSVLTVRYPNGDVEDFHFHSHNAKTPCCHLLRAPGYVFGECDTIAAVELVYTMYVSQVDAIKNGKTVSSTETTQKIFSFFKEDGTKLFDLITDAQFHYEDDEKEEKFVSFLGNQGHKQDIL